MKIGHIASLALFAQVQHSLGGFALAKSKDDSSGKAFHGSDGGKELFGGAAGEIPTEGEVGGGLVDGAAGEIPTEGLDGGGLVDRAAGEAWTEGLHGGGLVDGAAAEAWTEGEVGRADVEGLDGGGLVDGAAGEVSTEGEVGGGYTDAEGLDGGNLFDGAAGEEFLEEVQEIVLGVASDGYDGSIYQVDNGPPADDDPFDDVVVEDLDDSDANPPPPDYTPPPPNQGQGPGKKPDFEKGPDGKIRVILQFKEGKKATIMKGLQEAQLHFDWQDWNTVVISVPEQALNGLKNNPNIENLEPDPQVELIEPVAESDVQEEIDLFGDDIEPSGAAGSGNGSFRRRRLAQETPYGVDMMEVSKLKVRGNGQKVCVLDTGYDRNHPDPDLPYDVDWIGVSGTPPTDTGSHGTHVAGTIGALDNGHGVVGVALGARLVIGPYLKQTVTYVSNTVDGIRMCRDKGAKIVNMSFGSEGLKECKGGNHFNQWENDWLNQFYRNDNMLLVAAAGNHGSCSVNSTTPSYPASYDAVMSVAAVDWHARRWDSSAKNSYVNIAAPGVGVKSTVPEYQAEWWHTWKSYYGWKDGTSMAAPHVAAMAAVVWSAMPWLTAPELRQHLYNSASYTYEPYTGSGLVTHGFFPIVLQRSGKCLDHRGEGGHVHLWECHGGHQSLWTYDRSRKLIVSSAGWCLTANPWQGAGAFMSRCDPYNTNQQWDYDSNAKTFKLKGWCLDTDWYGHFKNGGIVQVWGCHAGNWQKWHLGNLNSEKALLCRHDNCYGGGDIYRASVGNWNYMPQHIGNDQLTRVMIPKGYAFQYFEHGNFGGWNRIYGSENGVNLYMGGHNDAVSSFKVRRLPDTGKVKLCRHIDCTGGVYYASVGQWSSMPSEIGNDELSFVHIPQGYNFEYFEHDNWGGWSRKFEACDRGIDLWMGQHNDAVSSFKIGLAC